jgi:hypothetical protein
VRVGAVPFVVSRCTGDPVRVDTEVVVVFESMYGPNRAEIPEFGRFGDMGESLTSLEGGTWTIMVDGAPVGFVRCILGPMWVGAAVAVVVRDVRRRKSGRSFGSAGFSIWAWSAKVM